MRTSFTDPPCALVNGRHVKIEFSNWDADDLSFCELEMQRATELSKPHYKAEGSSRPETVKSTTRTKVAVKAVESETAATAVQTETPPCTASVCPEEVRTRAFLKWEAAGCPEGDGIFFWLEAESELQGAK